MKPIITIIFLFLLRLLSAQALPDTVTLEFVQRLARQNALSVKTAEVNSSLAALDQQLYRARTKPRLDFSANLPNYFSSFNETVQPDGTVAFRPISINNSTAQLTLSQPITATGGTFFVRTNLQRFDDYENDQTNYNGIPVRVGFLQPIFGFNTWKWQKKILPLAAEEATSLHNAELQEVTALATRLFFELLIADQNRQIAKGNQAANERLFNIAKERYELGKINRGDLVQLELELAASGQNLIQADRSVARASLAIYTLLGENFTGASLIPAEQSDLNAPQVDPAEALRLARARRPETISQQRRVLEAERDLEQTKRQFGPQLQFNASLGLVRSDPELSNIYSDPQSEQIVSLQFSIPILDWGERKLAVKQATVQRDFVQLQNQREQLSLENNLLLAVDQWNQLAAELELSDRIRTLASDRFQISSESYLLGSIPLTELTLAQQNRDQLARAYLSTLTTYWLTYAELQRLTLYDFVKKEPL